MRNDSFKKKSHIAIILIFTHALKFDKSFLKGSRADCFIAFRRQ